MLHFAQDDLPFGGVGPSGMGHYHGREGFERLSKKKGVMRQSRFALTGLLGPPFTSGKRTRIGWLLRIASGWSSR